MAPIEYAARRCWAHEDLWPLERYEALAAAWDRSRCRLAEIESALAAGRERPAQRHPGGRQGVAAEAGYEEGVAGVVACGSLGRMELHARSDADLLVLVEDEAHAQRRVVERLWQRLEPMRLEPPKASGVFAVPAWLGALCDPADVGRVAERVVTFGQRMQLLLDAQPVGCKKALARTLDAILERYEASSIERDAKQNWSYLLHDLQRYFHSLCVRYRWELADRPGSWRLKDLKLRHGRRIGFAGLLLLVGECSAQRGDKVAWLRAHLRLTPLERIGMAARAGARGAMDEVLTCYDSYIARMGSDAFRAAVMEEPHAARGPLPHEANEAYRALAEGGDRLHAALVEVVLARRAAWDAALFRQAVL